MVQQGKDDSRRKSARKDSSKDSSKDERSTSGGDTGVGGFFKGLSSFIEFVSDLSERHGGVIERHGEIGKDKGVRAVYGFSVRVGGAQQGPARVEPFGNVRKGRGGQAEVVSTREPLCEVFEENDKIRIIAEMPGVEEPDVRCEVNDDIVSIRAKRGDRTYEKEIMLETPFTLDGMQKSFRNGIFELQLQRRKA